MPPITLHMVLARRIAQELADGELRSQMGAYLLGATTPDIRVPTREDRFATHFFRLDSHDTPDPVRTFL